jgi:outer membrane protein assembly factor BamB
MSIRLILLALVFAVGGCSPPAVGWRSFHGDLAGHGFRDVKSGFALSPAWVSETLSIAASSPVIGTDARNAEVVYVGTADGRLVAIDAETGTVLWRSTLGESKAPGRIVSAPAAVDDGVLVITTVAPEPGRLQSTLHKVDRQGLSRWSFAFPDGGFSTGAPKAMRVAGKALVVFGATVATPGRLRSELLVVRDAGSFGELLDRGSLGDCPVEGAPPGVQAEIGRVWSRLASAPGARGDNGPGAWFDPTPAVVQAGRLNPLVAVVDNHCRIGAFEWNGSRLVALWQASHPGEKHSSPALLPNRLMVFGGQSGRLFAYDAETGVKMWEAPMGAPVLATPAAAGGAVFVIAGDQLQAVAAVNGGAIIQSGAPQRLKLPAATLSSPAVTAQRVYVAAGEMLTVSHDFKVRSHNTGFAGNGLSSPAVGGDGSLYVVAADGSLWKYQGAQ